MSKFIVADAKGVKLRDLGPEGIRVGEIIGVESEGPVTFLSGPGRREGFAPFFVSGDVDGVPNPWPVGAGTVTVRATAGLAQDYLDVTVPVVNAVTALTKKFGSTGGGDGMVNANPSGFHVKGWEQNIVLSDGRDYSVSNGISEMAYTRDRQNAIFRGQPLYVEGLVRDSGGKLWPVLSPPQVGMTPVPTNIGFTGFAFLTGGYSPEMPGVLPHWKDMYHHGVYVNRYGKIVFKRCIFGNNANCGTKIMRDALLDECVILHNSIALQALYGRIELRDSVIYRSSMYWDQIRDTGNLGFDVYSPLTLTNTLCVGGPPTTWANPLENPQSLGLLKLNRSHKQYTDTPGGSVTAFNCRAHNWPLSLDGKMYSGDAWTTGQALPGMTVTTGPAIHYDEQVTLDAMRRYEIGVEDACLKLLGDIRKLV